MKKFWNWLRNDADGESELYLDGAIASETWWGDEVTPAAFQAALKQHTGDVTVWINSPGGDVFAAAQIFISTSEMGPFVSTLFVFMIWLRQRSTPCCGITPARSR